MTVLVLNEFFDRIKTQQDIWLSQLRTNGTLVARQRHRRSWNINYREKSQIDITTYDLEITSEKVDLHKIWWLSRIKTSILFLAIDCLLESLFWAENFETSSNREKGNTWSSYPTCFSHLYTTFSDNTAHFSWASWHDKLEQINNVWPRRFDVEQHRLIGRLKLVLTCENRCQNESQNQYAPDSNKISGDWKCQNCHYLIAHFMCVLASCWLCARLADFK